jgi:hypothetical protein
MVCTIYVYYSMYHVYMDMKKLENSYCTKQTLMDPMLCTHGPFNGLSLERDLNIGIGYFMTKTVLCDYHF